MGPFGKRNALSAVLETPGQPGTGYFETNTGSSLPNYLKPIVDANAPKPGSRFKAMSGGGNATEWWGDEMYKTPEYVYLGQRGTHTSGTVDNQIANSFLTPDKRAKTEYWTPEVQAGRRSLLNGKPYDILDAQGNVTGQGTFEGLSDADSMDNVALAMVSLGFGAALAGAGAAATGAGGASGGGAGAVGSGAGFVGEGAASGIGAWDAALASSPSWSAGAAGAGAAGYGAGGATEPAASLSTAGAGEAAALGPGVVPPNPYHPGSYLSPTNLGNLIKSGAGSMANGFSWTDLIGPALNLAGGAMGAEAAGDAADAQLQAAREAAARFEPWRQVGEWGINRAGTMLGREGHEAAKAAFVGSPDYAFRQNEQQNALTRKLSALGLRESGKHVKDTLRYSGDLASSEFDKSLNRLLAISGMGQTATGSSADYLTQGANAQAAGTVGAANAWGNALTQGYGMYQNNQQQNQNALFQNALLAKYMGA